MNEQLLQLAKKIASTRKNIPQLYFFDTVEPKNVIQVRRAIIEFKKSKPEINEIDVLIHSPGGLADDAYRIIRTLRNNFGTVNIIVPFWAKSAATLISLGASNIILDEFSELGPLDAQLVKPRDDSPEYERESALNDESSLSILENRYKLMYEQMYLRLYNHRSINIPKTEVSQQLLKNLSIFFKPLLSQINPYKLGEKKRILDTGGQYALRILNQFAPPSPPQDWRKLVNYLLNECPDHGYVVDIAIMKAFLSNVYDSTHFGQEYKINLQELSLYLMEEDLSEDSFIELLFQEAEESQPESTSEIPTKDQQVETMIESLTKELNGNGTTGQVFEN